MYNSSFKTPVYWTILDWVWFGNTWDIYCASDAPLLLTNEITRLFYFESEGIGVKLQDSNSLFLSIPLLVKNSACKLSPF